MRAIISPAKNMHFDDDFLEPRNRPLFLDRAERLADYLKTLSLNELKTLLGCNDRLAALNFERYRQMDLRGGRTSPAILSYDGIQYRYMAPQLCSYGELDYIEEHIRILSGFYGLLRPFDGVTPYRLEMQARLRTDFCVNLYDYWGDTLARTLLEEDPVILNLASGEYSRAVTRHIGHSAVCITCLFGELADGVLKEKGVYVKMARGEMVRFMAENRLTRPQEVQHFDRLGYVFCPSRSDDRTYTFLREKGNHYHADSESADADHSTYAPHSRSALGQGQRPFGAGCSRLSIP